MGLPILGKTTTDSILAEHKKVIDKLEKHKAASEAEAAGIKDQFTKLEEQQANLLKEADRAGTIAAKLRDLIG